MGQKTTILEAAVKRGLPRATDETREQVVTLLRQIGALENRNADLEIGIKAISAKCYWRSMGYCDLGCGGRVFCDVKGLNGFDWSSVQDASPSPQGGHTGPPLQASLEERSAG